MRRLSIVALLGLLSSAGVLTAAPAAQAKIVLGESIGGVKLGASQQQVKTALGKPSACNPSCGPKAKTWTYSHGFAGIIEFNSQGHIQSMWTGSPKQMTGKGIHPGAIGKHGSSLADIKKAYPSAKCEELPNSGGFASCDLISHYHGRKVDTNFLIKAASFGVAEIAIQFV